MDIKIKFILGVALLAIQLSSTRAGSSDVKLTAQLVNYIKGENFGRAFVEAFKLDRDRLQTIMNAVIRDVYQNDVRNIKLILKFVDSDPTEKKVSFTVYNALGNQLTGDVDYLYRLKILKSFNGKPFNLKKEKFESFRNKLETFAKKKIVKILKEALKSKDNSRITVISVNIHQNVPALFGKVISQILDESFDEIDTVYLIKFFTSHEHASQSMSAYSAVFEHIKSNLDRPLAVTLAFAIKQAADKSKDAETSDEGNRLRDALPLSTRNLAFYSDHIAIKNEKYREHLYAASDGFIYPDSAHDKRQIFTWTPKALVSQGIWGVEQNGDTYWIKNIRNSSNSEYLFRSTVHIGYPMGFTYTWLTGPPDSDQFDWVFEPSGDYVYIKNTHYKEYLYASTEFEGFTDDRRFVYTDTQNKKPPGSLWKIVVAPRVKKAD